MTTRRVVRKDGTIFDAPAGYIMLDGDRIVTTMLMRDGAAPLTDEQVLDAVRDEMRPKDTSRLSAAQLRRAFVAMKLNANADEMLAKSDSFIEGAFRALTADMNARHVVKPDVVETRADGTTRDAASVVVDGFTVTPEMAHAAGYDSAAGMVAAETARAAAYDMGNAERNEAWRDPARVVDDGAHSDAWDAYRARLGDAWKGEAA